MRVTTLILSVFHYCFIYKARLRGLNCNLGAMKKRGFCHFFTAFYDVTSFVKQNK